MRTGLISILATILAVTTLGDAAVPHRVTLSARLVNNGTPFQGQVQLTLNPMAEWADTATKLGKIGESDLQRRVTATCAAGSSIRAIDPSGAVACEPDDDTTPTAGTGIAIHATRRISVQTNTDSHTCRPVQNDDNTWTLVAASPSGLLLSVTCKAHCI